jgi:hypothetical protein
MVSDFAWGTPNAQPVTLSFWVYSSVIGTFGGAIQNYAISRSFPFSFQITAINTWTRVVIPIFGDPNGAWVMGGNVGSVIISFSLGVGATRQGPAGVWASANYLTPPATVNLVNTNGAAIGFTGVKLEIGSVASRFVRKSPQESLADCQRYYYDAVGMTISGFMIAGLAAQTSISFPTVMRTAPTVTLRGLTFTGGATAMGAAASSLSSFLPTVTSSVQGQSRVDYSLAANAEL